MDIIDAPFLKFSPDELPRPWLPLTIRNPHTNQAINVYGLIDTGADECAIPAAYAHTLCFETRGIKIENVLIDFMPNLNVVLLGVRSFLSNFVLTVDYKKSVFSLKQK